LTTHRVFFHEIDWNPSVRRDGSFPDIWSGDGENDRKIPAWWENSGRGIGKRPEKIPIWWKIALRGETKRLPVHGN
jgi:hypothetical protein